MSPVLRDYQAEALAAVRSAAGRGITRALVVLPTGAGKTVVFAELARRAADWRSCRVLILAHRDELIGQAAGKLRHAMPDADIGILKAERDEHDHQIVVASVQTLAAAGRLDRVTPDFGLLIVDEAHHAPSRTYLRILEWAGCLADGGTRLAGFTATASRADRAPLERVFQEIVYEQSIMRMMRGGYLVNAKAQQVAPDFTIGNVTTRGGDYSGTSIAGELDRSEALQAAAIGYREHAADRKGVAFAPTVATSRKLTELLTGEGITAEHLDGTTPAGERTAILGRLRDGTTQVVSNVGVLTEGWDEPSVSAVLMCRPTKSEGLYIQMCGRVLRPHPGKDDALILDVTGGASAIGLVTISTLLGRGQVKPGESLMEAAERQEAEEEAAAVRKVEQVQAREVDLFARARVRWSGADGGARVLSATGGTAFLIPAGPGRWEVWGHAKGSGLRMLAGPVPLDQAMAAGEDLAGPQWRDGMWQEREVTDGQRAELTRRGYGAQIDGMTRGVASDLISELKARQSLRQITRLRKHRLAA
jgi:superfamily II DNA or RNA helicase